MNSSTSLLVFTPRHHLALASVLHYLPASWFVRDYPSSRLDYPSVSLLHLIVYWWYRNIYLLSITYGFRPRLRSRLTLGGRTFPRKPETFDGIDSHYALATYAGILSCILSTAPSDTASACIHCSSTHIFTYMPKLRWQVLAPVIFGAPPLDQWAITHSLNEWLLLSQHPGCLSNNTSFST